MKKAMIMICVLMATMALTSCSVEDNPSNDPFIEPNDTTMIDNPNESVTDQPAYAPGL